MHMNSIAKASKFKDGMFWIRRNDTDLLVISTKYVDELRGLPESKASPIQAHIRVGKPFLNFNDLSCRINKVPKC